MRPASPSAAHAGANDRTLANVALGKPGFSGTAYGPALMDEVSVSK